MKRSALIESGDAMAYYRQAETCQHQPFDPKS